MEGTRTFRIGIIRVLTQDQEATESHGRLIEHWFGQFETVSRSLPDQPEGVHDPRTKALAVPKVVALARELESAGLDGIIVSCADDPGVPEIRAVAHIPVVGAGEATAQAALRFGNRIGVLGITETVPASFRRILQDRLVADIVPEGVSCTLDLRTDAGHSATVDAARELAKKDIDAIALACTGLADANIAPTLERATGVPVLDPVLCAAHALLFDLVRGADTRRA
ncbi:aspartate/glutamate racemase family protein [Raoultibacter phocaeensis]|uniref:aspartate/glutamate racemase family protein n=1 Tax=Raoultibacter phocaeensis TaxID=2479841 RepID=UPI00111A9600|nr:aspartate/glutamate racemase family protein [Raoultibacter phocaeensis]